MAVPEITAIEPQESKAHRYSIFVDGQFALGVDERVVISLGLEPGQPITADKLAQISAEEEARRAWEAATRLLEHRPRSRQELGRRLRQKDFADATIGRVLDRLEDLGLINDDDFARQLVRSLAGRRHLSKRAIFDRLRRAQISRDIAEAAMAGELVDYDEAAQAKQVVDKYLPRLAGADHEKQRRRLWGYLRRRGFSHSLISEVLAAALSDC